MYSADALLFFFVHRLFNIQVISFVSSWVYFMLLVFFSETFAYANVPKSFSCFILTDSVFPVGM